jgi:hypothetical protein
MSLLIATALLFLLSMLGLAVGVMLTGRCLQGSCGGKGVIGPDGTPLSCATCPNRRRKKPASPAQDSDVDD